MSLNKMREREGEAPQADIQISHGVPSTKRILLIKLRYLGDVVLCTPILPLLRKHFPDATITFLVNPGTDSVLENNPNLDDVWVLPQQPWWQQWEFFSNDCEMPNSIP